MSNAQTHLIAGTIASLILAIIFTNFFNISQEIILIGIFLGIISSEFPDIDHSKSLPRKIMRGIIPAILLFIFGYFFMIWEIWTREYIVIGIFISILIIIIYFYEFLIPRHRGSTHKLPGLVALLVFTAFIPFLFNWKVINVITLSVFVILGFSTHIILDNI